ncbi:hypothetical protein G7Y89_g8400 [Cudoniella acicularis]|uniref:Major facilitator superfamily (MFS) profile domain-containing protein n=1 Tax=Cudoniella acicularis TaxID=354080 RepID=A0A8H4RJ73_9HELO|nr:hypothetical protein G7Y89_g8400 [Cudoniella acicularis]
MNGQILPEAQSSQSVNRDKIHIQHDNKKNITPGEKNPDLRSIEQSSTSREVVGPRWAIIIVAIVSSTFLYALDNTILANIRPSIVESFGDPGTLPWISVAYAMMEVGSNPFWGKMYSQFDPKYLFLASLFIFEAGSALCGASPTTNVLIAGRAICGIGGSGIYVGTMNIISILTTPLERPLYLSFVGMAWATGTVLGPIIGGAFADSSMTWRWSFFINLCLAAPTLPALTWLLPSCYTRTEASISERVKRIDFIGIVLFLGGTITLIMALSYGGSLFSWNSGPIIVLYVTCFAVWIVFGIQQYWSIWTTDRVFPGQLLRSYEMCILFAQSSAAIASIIGTLYSIPLFFQFVRNESALKSGIRTLPFISAGVVGTMANGAFFPKFNLYWIWFSTAGILVTAGAGLLSQITIDTTPAHIYGYSVIEGLGAGLIAQAPYSVAQLKVNPKDVHYVTAFITCGQMAGVALSLGISTCLFVNEATGLIANILPGVSHDAVLDAITGANSRILQEQPVAVRLKILEAITTSVGHVFFLVVGGGALCIISSLAMKRERLPFGKAHIIEG